MNWIYDLLLSVRDLWMLYQIKSSYKLFDKVRSFKESAFFRKPPVCFSWARHNHVSQPGFGLFCCGSLWWSLSSPTPLNPCLRPNLPTDCSGAVGHTWAGFPFFSAGFRFLDRRARAVVIKQEPRWSVDRSHRAVRHRSNTGVADNTNEGSATFMFQEYAP